MSDCQIEQRVRVALGNQLPTRVQVHAIINAEMDPTMDMTARCVTVVHVFEHILDVVGEVMDSHVFDYVEVYGIDMQMLGHARMVRDIARQMDLEVLGMVEVESMDDLASALGQVNFKKETLH